MVGYTLVIFHCGLTPDGSPAERSGALIWKFSHPPHPPLANTPHPTPPLAPYEPHQSKGNPRVTNASDGSTGPNNPRFRNSTGQNPKSFLPALVFARCFFSPSPLIKGSRLKPGLRFPPGSSLACHFWAIMCFNVPGLIPGEAVGLGIIGAERSRPRRWRGLGP